MVLLCLPAPAVFAGQDSGLPAGAKIFIAPMEWQMEQHLASEIRRQGLPVELVADEAAADYVMTGSAEKLSSHFMAPGRSFHIILTRLDGSQTVWTGEGDDYATVFGRLRSHGPARAARTIVEGLRNRYFRKAR